MLNNVNTAMIQKKTQCLEDDDGQEMMEDQSDVFCKTVVMNQGQC